MSRLCSRAGNRDSAAAQPELPVLVLRAAGHEHRFLISSIALIMGGGVLLAIPFALRAGAEFFLPVTAALVIAISLVPLLEWLERRRIPSTLAALFCVILFIAMANIAVAAIVFPATEWFKALPDPATMTVDARLAEFDSYDGPLEVPFAMLHQRVEALLGRPVWTHEFASSVWPRLRIELQPIGARVGRDDGHVLGDVLVVQHAAPIITGDDVHRRRFRGESDAAAPLPWAPRRVMAEAPRQEPQRSQRAFVQAPARVVKSHRSRRRSRQSE